MPKLPQIRGALLEEIILLLLSNIGYEIVNADKADTQIGRSGLEVQGRGEWHQIDAFARLQYTPAFMYPLRLILEAKCYKNSRPVGINVVRNAVGVQKDISENYFTHSNQNDELKFQRYNYHSAIFSTSGYTRGAQNYALAHQIFLIQYENVRILEPIADSLLNINPDYFSLDNINDLNLSELREGFRLAINEEAIEPLNDYLSVLGYEELYNPVMNNLNEIEGSYFGMLQGKYPIHLISEMPLPRQLFQDRDQIKCRIIRNNNGNWSFASLRDQPDFNLEFDLPRHIAQVINNMDDRREIANQKRELFSFIDISGRIDGIFRNVKLVLDENWLDRFLENLNE